MKNELKLKTQFHGSEISLARARGLKTPFQLSRPTLPKFVRRKMKVENPIGPHRKTKMRTKFVRKLKHRN